MKHLSLNIKSHYIYYCLMFFLPLWLFIDNIFLLLLFVSVILFKKEKINTRKLIYHSFIVLTVYIVAIGIISNQFLSELKNYIKILPLVVIPVSMISFRKEETKTGLYFLLLGILVMQLIAIYGVIDYYYFTEGKKIALRSYAKVNDILRFERPYVGYFSALSFIISYALFKDKKRWLALLQAIISIAVIIIISARLAVIIVLTSFIMMLAYEIQNVRYKLTFLIITILLGFMTLKMSDTPIQHRFSEMKYDARVIIWKGAFNIYNNTSEYFFGLGGQQQIRSSLLHYYKTTAEFEYTPDKERFINKNYNTHNQYLNELLRGGILGISLYIIPFLLVAYKSIKAKHLLTTLLLFSIAAFSLVENVLDRQMGVYIVALIMSISNNFLDEKSYT